MALKKYRKLPIEVDALEFTGDNAEEFIEEFGNGAEGDEHAPTVTGKPLVWWAHNLLEVWTRNDWVVVEVGDFVVKDSEGYPYPCKPDVFNRVHEELA